MTNQQHVEILLRDGVQAWNQWREENPDGRPDLSNASLFKVNLSGADLSESDFGDKTDLTEVNLSWATLRGADLDWADLSGADLSGADLSGANLCGAHLNDADIHSAHLIDVNLSYADLSGADLSDVDLRSAHLGDADLRGAHLRKADLSEAFLHGARLNRADLTGATFQGAYLRMANLTGADLHKQALSGVNLSDADLSDADLSDADLSGADMHNANLSGARLGGANLRRANLSGAHLSGAGLAYADLQWAGLSGANLSGANLSGANLSEANCVRANLDDATLTGCNVYGIAACDVRLEGAVQADLYIASSFDEAHITVDNLEVAQFLYLLLHNEKMRAVLDTITSKVVLILGRFNDERKPVLDALREALRSHPNGYIPVLFDFGPQAERHVADTVKTLANLARFIIADVTDAHVVRTELALIVPALPDVPVQPIVQRDAELPLEYTWWRRFPSVLPVHGYVDLSDLLANLNESVISPVEARVHARHL